MHDYPHIPQAILDAWPNCATPDCGNKSCTWAPRPNLCFPCNERLYGHSQMVAIFNETHDVSWDEAEA